MVLSVGQHRPEAVTSPLPDGELRDLADRLVAALLAREHFSAGLGARLQELAGDGPLVASDRRYTLSSRSPWFTITW